MRRFANPVQAGEIPARSSSFADVAKLVKALAL